jgi:hypothetical protein
MSGGVSTPRLRAGDPHPRIEPRDLGTGGRAHQHQPDLGGIGHADGAHRLAQHGRRRLCLGGRAARLGRHLAARDTAEQALRGGRAPAPDDEMRRDGALRAARDEDGHALGDRRLRHAEPPGQRHAQQEVHPGLVEVVQQPVATRLAPQRDDAGRVDAAIFQHRLEGDEVVRGGMGRRMGKQAVMAPRLEQRGRIAGRSLEPQLPLMDEPLSNLAAKLRGTLTRVGTITLVVTHDQEEAMALADRIAIMSAGRVQQLGTPQEVYERPACRFVAELLGRALWLDGRVEAGHFVTTRGGVLACPPPGRVAARHGLLIRPEALHLDAADGGWNRLPAQVAGARYRGAATLLDLLVEGMVPVAIEAPRGTPLPAPGATVTLAARPEDCLAVPEDEVPRAAAA